MRENYYCGEVEKHITSKIDPFFLLFFVFFFPPFVWYPLHLVRILSIATDTQKGQSEVR